MSEGLRKRTFEIMERGLGDDMDLPSRLVENGITTLIILNAVAVIIETIPSVRAQWAGLLRAFEMFTVAVFTVEYAARLWSCTTHHRYRGAITGRVRFALTPMAMVDLLAFLPFYIVFGLPLPVRVLRVFRVLRLVRILKLGRYSRAAQTVLKVLAEKRRELAVAFAVVLVLLVVSASLYCAEHDAQPDAFGSIPRAMWWAVATLSTVGYGNVCPVTQAGKLLAGLIALLAIGTFALPAGILAAGMTEELQSRFGIIRLCPHCGMNLDQKPIAPAPEPKSQKRLRDEADAAAEYKPQPIDTSSVSLPEGLSELIEHLAESVHDHWALMRTKEGWRYGPARDDRLRVHPDLVPYDVLTEADREYDRKTAVESLKAILALGYRIVPADATQEA